MAGSKLRTLKAPAWLIKECAVAPNTPPSNQCVVYALDDGGNTQLNVKFASGEIQPLISPDGVSAAATSFLQSGTGAVSRTVQAELRDRVKVKQFGAVGDGVTNDKAAIQAAHDALPASGGELYFPDGVYAIASGLSFTKPVRLVGSGKSQAILNASAAGYALVTSTHTLVVEHLSFTRTPYASNTQWAALRIDNITTSDMVQFIVDDVSIIGFDIGIYVNGHNGSNVIKLDRYSVTNTRIEVNSARTGTGVQGTMHFHNTLTSLIDNCVLIQTGTDAVNNVYTIGSQIVAMRNCWVEGGVCFKVVSSNRTVKAVEFVNNYVYHSSSAGVLCNASTYTIHHVTVRGNTFEGSYAPDAAAGEIMFGTEFTPTIAYDLLTIEGNFFNLPQGRCVMFGIGAGSTLRHASLRGNTYFGWSAGSSGTYSAVDAGTGGTKEVISVDQEVAIGNGTGRSYHGTNFTKQLIGHVVETGITNATFFVPFTIPTLPDASVTKCPVVTYSSQPNIGVGTDADTAEKTLATKTLDVNVLNATGGWIDINAFGTTAANANVKTIKLKVGSTVVTTNAITTAPNGVMWKAHARVYRTGSSFSSRFAQMWVGAVVEAVGASSSTSLSWASGTVTVSVTGQNGTAAANDIVCYGMGIDVGAYR